MDKLIQAILQPLLSKQMTLIQVPLGVGCSVLDFFRYSGLPAFLASCPTQGDLAALSEAGTAFVVIIESDAEDLWEMFEGVADMIIVMIGSDAGEGSFKIVKEGRS